MIDFVLVLFYLIQVNAMMVSGEIEEAITEVVRANFSDARIKYVRTKAAEDSDGDPVLQIFVVFESNKEQDTLDGEKMAGLARHIMERLSAMHQDAFPLVSFVSAKDAAKLNLAVA